MKLITEGAEGKLVEHLTTQKTAFEKGVVVHFNLHKLLEHYRSDYQIKIATNLLTDLLKQQDGQIYLLKDCSVIISGAAIPEPLMEKAIFQLRYLFMDDPLAYRSDGRENPDFCSRYVMPDDYDALSSMARKRMLELGKSGKSGQSGGGAGQVKSAPQAEPVPSASKVYFSASNLERIERKIEQTDILPAIRCQPVCATVPNMSVRRVFDELYINIDHLRKLIDTDTDLLSNRWLFKYLTLAMDKRVIELIQKSSGAYLNSPISLNLNVRTLMSAAFTEFDAFLKPSSKVSVVLEVQASDVFEDMYAFMLARDTMQKRGYRICLDGVNHMSFPMMNRDLLGVDLVKLQWNANIKSDIYNAENQQVADAVKRCGSNRIILTRCDDRKAVDYGQALGISLFQGRYLDELIDPMSDIVN